MTLEQYKFTTLDKEFVRWCSFYAEQFIDTPIFIWQFLTPMTIVNVEELGGVRQWLRVRSYQYYLLCSHDSFILKLHMHSLICSNVKILYVPLHALVVLTHHWSYKRCFLWFKGPRMHCAVDYVRNDVTKKKINRK